MKHLHIIMDMDSPTSYMIAVQWVHKWGENYCQCCCPKGKHKLCLPLSKREDIISVAVCGDKIAFMT